MDGTAPAGIPRGYRPALDGIRAIAIIAVVLYHLGLDGGFVIVQHGWLGVDVFFVLSGYLITSLLLGEHGDTGRISLRNFYIRRFLRLAPLSVALVAALLALRVGDLDRALGIHLPVGSGLSVLFYYANWWGMANPRHPGPLGHAWSLSIEEQFYFLWPLVVVAGFWLFGRGARRALTVFTFGAALAMALARRAIWYGGTGSGASYDQVISTWRTFYSSSFLRPDGLLIGCLTALVLYRRVATRTLVRVVTGLGVAGCAIATFLLVRGDPPAGGGGIPVEPTGTLSVFNVSVAFVLAWLVLVPRSPVARLIGATPLAWIGRRAYGIYLLHPLVLAVVVHRLGLRRLPLEAVTILVTLVVAGASFRWFETPFLHLKERFAARPAPPGPSDDARPGAATRRRPEPHSDPATSSPPCEQRPRFD